MKLIIVVLMNFLVLNLFAQNIEITPELIQKMKNTNPVNMDEIVDHLDLKRWHKKNPKIYSIANPFYPMTRVNKDEVDLPDPINGQKAYVDHNDGTVSFYHQRKVYEWFNLKPKDEREAEVCGIKFLDNEKKTYHLKSFENKDLAQSEGYLVTHQNHCGACSSLYDLAIYLEKRNMVEDGRKCAKKLTLKGSRKCHLERIELSRYCSEAWAYNATATRNRCMKNCIKEYGLVNILRGKYPDVFVNDDGSLKPCILCDELKSGGGYAYSVGRTRRSSGIKSAIDRGAEELYPIDYETYYKIFDL